MVQNRGLYVFASSCKDEYLYERLIQDILSKIELSVYRNLYVDDLSHCKSINNSIFIDNTLSFRLPMPCFSLKLREKVEKLIMEQDANKNTQILSVILNSDPLVKRVKIGNKTTTTNHYSVGNLITASDFFGVIIDNHFKIRKSRWNFFTRVDNSDNYQDISLAPLLRDDKINKILNIWSV
jgi:hypothetical protein